MSTIFHPLPTDVAITEDMISINIMNYFHYKHTTANFFSQSNVYINIAQKQRKILSNLHWIHSEAYDHKDLLVNFPSIFKEINIHKLDQNVCNCLRDIKRLSPFLSVLVLIIILTEYQALQFLSDPD